MVQLVRKNTHADAENVHTVLFFNSRKGFYYFELTSRKLISKTLLWSLFITCATLEINGANQNPQ